MIYRKCPLSCAQLKEILHYDPETGAWAVKKAYNRYKIGPLIPGKRRQLIYIEKKLSFLSYRLAWFYMTGTEAETGVDHINGNFRDNRWSNLRLADQSKNSANSRICKNNKCGKKGVYWDKTKNKWSANIKKDRKTIHLGRYVSLEEAKKAYDLAANSLFGEFARYE